LNPAAIHLRPEATPLPYYKLTSGQRAAYERLVQMLTGSARESPPAAKPARGAVVVDFDRKARVAVVSGGRGTGKTSAVLSLIQDVTSGKGPTFGPDPSPNDEPDQKNLAETVKELSQRVVWLEILDMAPLPLAANLFSAVLARVEDAATRLLPAAEAEEPPRSYLDPPELYDSPVEKLRRLQTDVAVSWEGNLRQRSGALDANAFAAEVRRSEFVRMKLNRKLTEVLDGLSEAVGRRAVGAEALFVLPVDDFDLNPPRCLELLELLRTLSVPRLFFLVLGDVDVAETMCGLQIAGDIAKVAGLAPAANFLPVHQADVQATVANVAGNMIRKLLPPAQRIHLEPLRVEQAVEMRPPGKSSNAPSVGDWFKKIPFILPQLDPQVRTRFPPKKKEGDPTVYDFLFRQNENAPAPFYQARKFLEMPLRLLVDFWQALEETVTRSVHEERPLDRLRRKLHYFCRDVCQAEETLPPEARRNFRAAFAIDPDTGWTISPEPFRLVTPMYRVEVDATGTAPTPADESVAGTSELTWRVHGRSVSGWEFRSRREDEPVNPLFLTPATTDLIIFFTDLVTLSREDAERNALFSLRDTGFQFVEHRYQFRGWESPPLPWSFPPVLTFWEADRFLDGWTLAVRRLDAAVRGTTTTFELLPPLVYHWIAVGTAVLAGTPILRSMEELSIEEEEWDDLKTDVEKLFRAVRSSRVRSAVHRWIAEVLSLLNPDVLGADETPRKAFRASQELADHCRKTGMAFARWHAAALTADKSFTVSGPGERPSVERSFWRAVDAMIPWWQPAAADAAAEAAPGQEQPPPESDAETSS
jgi:hypothetical protein